MTKHTLISDINGMPLRIDVHLNKVERTAVIEKQERVMKDSKGKLVNRMVYLKATGELLPRGSTGNKYVNDEGQDVVSSEIHYFVETEDETKEVTQFVHERNVTFSFEPIEMKDAIIVLSEFEVIPQSDNDRIEMWKLAKFLRDSQQVAVGVVIPMKGWNKYVIILVPYIDEEIGQFSILAKFAQENLKLTMHQKIPTDSELGTAKTNEIESDIMKCSIFKEAEKNKLIESDPEVIITLGKYIPKYDKPYDEMDELSHMILDVKKDETKLDVHSGEYQYYDKALDNFTKILNSILSNTEEFVICVMPTHMKGTAPSGIRAIAKRLCSSPRIDGTGILSRVYEIPKKAMGGSRDLSAEMNSLAVKDEAMVKESQVLLIDDVTTTGTSLKAGRIQMLRAGAKTVTLLALAETQKKEDK